MNHIEISVKYAFMNSRSLKQCTFSKQIRNYVMERIQEAMKCDVYARFFHYRHLTFKLQSEIKVNHK